MMCGQNKGRAGISHLLLWAALTALPLGGLVAQTQTMEYVAPRKKIFWHAQMPTGSYIVEVSTITSISMHSYVVDGSVRVTDVTIGTQGSELARFYFMEPNVPSPSGGVGEGTANLLKDRAKEAAGRADVVGASQQVVKNYPTTTHARTIEYRMETLESLKKLFLSIEDSFRNQKDGSFKP